MRKSVLIKYNSRGNGESITIFSHGKSRTYKYTAKRFDYLVMIVSKLEWDADLSNQSENYFYYVG